MDSERAMEHLGASSSLQQGDCAPAPDIYHWPDGSLKWGHPIDVRHLILQLQTVDPETKISSVTFIDFPGGARRARAYGLSMSWERWGNDGWLDFRLDVPKCLAFWATERLDGHPALDPAVHGNTPLRMWIALEMLRAWNHGTAGFSAGVVCVVNEWLDGGKKGPIPWPDDPFFSEWAAQKGFHKIDGKYVGFLFTAKLLDPTRTNSVSSDVEPPDVAGGKK